LVRMVKAGSDQRRRLPVAVQAQPEVAKSMSAEETAGWHPARFACPDCNGVLWEIDDGQLLRFRCRVGHALTAEALLDGKADELEGALWSAINTMEERAELSDRLERRTRSTGHAAAADRHRRTADDMRAHAVQLRQLLDQSNGFRLESVEAPAPAPAPDAPK
jgi:two-component system, chemotaxis family, protein-glutamate methylesterase/glutaminase